MNPRLRQRGRGAATLAAALLLVLALAACGGSGASGSSGSEATQAASAPESRPTEAGQSRAATAKPETGAASPGPGKPAASSSGAVKTHGGPASRPDSQPSAAAAPGAAGTPTTAAPASTTAAPARTPARRKAPIARRHLVRAAGTAAPFLVAQGDNSIPTYGSEAPPAQLAAVEEVLSGYLGARAAGDWASACSLMSASVAKQIVLLAGEPGSAQTSCAATYAKLSERTPASERANPLLGGLAAVRVEAPHAFALFYGPGSQQYMMPLQEEGGSWRVTQIAPLSWPLGAPAGGE